MAGGGRGTGLRAGKRIKLEAPSCGLRAYDSETLAQFAHVEASHDGTTAAAQQPAAEQLAEILGDEDGADHRDLGADDVDDQDAAPRLGVINLPMFDDVDEWLLQECTAHAGLDGRVVSKVHVLELTQQGEVVMLMPAYQAERRLIGCDAVRDPSRTQQDARLNPFTLLRVRRIDCRDGAELCCVCCNPGCPRSWQEQQDLLHEMQDPEQPDRLRQEVFGDWQPLCRCAQAAITAEFGSVGDINVNEDAATFCSWLLQQDPFGAKQAQCLSLSRLIDEDQTASLSQVRCH